MGNIKNSSLALKVLIKTNYPKLKLWRKILCQRKKLSNKKRKHKKFKEKNLKKHEKKKRQVFSRIKKRIYPSKTKSQALQFILFRENFMCGSNLVGIFVTKPCIFIKREREKRTKK